MPKRSYRETDEERWRRKQKKYEAKLAKKKRRRIVYSSDEADDVQIEEHLNDDIMPSTEFVEPEINIFSENESAVEQYSPDLITSVQVSAPGISTESTTQPISAPDIPSLDPDLIQALGDCHADIPEWGSDILPDISQRWEPLSKTGLTKEIKDDLLKKYLFPKNAPFLKPPVLNPEIAAMLTDAAKNRDARLCLKQGQIGRVIAAVGKAMTGIVMKNMETAEILRILSDAGKLFVDSHYLETDTRRSLIVPLLEKSYVAPLKDRKRDNFLFGENLAEFIKSSRGVKKTSQLIAPTPTTSAPSTSNLNWKGPPRQQRANRFQGYRNGGPRAAQRAQRRAPPPPPAPPTAPRRAPPNAGPSRRPAPQSTYRPRYAT